MKYFIIIVILLLPVATIGADDDLWSDELLLGIMELEGGDEFIQDIIDRLEKDKETIRKLRAERGQLYDKIIVLTQERNIQKGFYLGGNLGYPLGNADAIVLYKWERWGLYSLAGYNNGFNINLGILFKL